MKKLFIVSIFLACIQAASAQKIDTIYYDSDWKGVQTKALASYMRIANMANVNQSDNTVKDYYITGELQGDGLVPVYIDKNDDKNSKFKGHIITYYKSGIKSSERNRNDSGQLDGEYAEYYENGLKKAKGTYTNGISEGELTTYFENGNPEQVFVFQNGLSREATIYNENGVKLTLLKGSFENGTFEGERTDYYENGLRKNKGIIKNGKWDGTYYQFNVDGSYAELEYKNGQPQNDYIFVGLNGKRTKKKYNNVK